LHIQFRPIPSYVHAFHITNFFNYSIVARRAGIVENIIFYFMALPLHLSQNAVFLLGSLLDSNMMRCNAFQHIGALSDVDDTTVQPNTVDAWVFKFRCPSPTPIHCDDIFNIFICQFLTTCFSFSINIITFILLKIKNRRIIWKFSELFYAKQKGASISGRIIAGFCKGYMLGSRNFPEHFLFRRTVDTSIPDQNILSRQTGINEK